MSDDLMQNDAARLNERATYLRTQIDGICEQLKGHGVRQAERLMLHEDRKDMRRELAEIEAAIAKATGAA